MKGEGAEKGRDLAEVAMVCEFLHSLLGAFSLLTKTHLAKDVVMLLNSDQASELSQEGIGRANLSDLLSGMLLALTFCQSHWVRMSLDEFRSISGSGSGSDAGCKSEDTTASKMHLLLASTAELMAINCARIRAREDLLAARQHRTRRGRDDPWKCPAAMEREPSLTDYNISGEAQQPLSDLVCQTAMSVVRISMGLMNLVRKFYVHPSFDEASDSALLVEVRRLKASRFNQSWMAISILSKEWGVLYQLIDFCRKRNVPAEDIIKDVVLDSRMKMRTVFELGFINKSCSSRLCSAYIDVQLAPAKLQGGRGACGAWLCRKCLNEATGKDIAGEAAGDLFGAAEDVADVEPETSDTIGEEDTLGEDRTSEEEGSSGDLYEDEEFEYGENAASDDTQEFFEEEEEEEEGWSYHDVRDEEEKGLYDDDAWRRNQAEAASDVGYEPEYGLYDSELAEVEKEVAAQMLAEMAQEEGAAPLLVEALAQGDS